MNGASISVCISLLNIHALYAIKAQQLVYTYLDGQDSHLMFSWVVYNFLFECDTEEWLHYQNTKTTPFLETAIWAVVFSIFLVANMALRLGYTVTCLFGMLLTGIVRIGKIPIDSC